jgi:hypothetical protein
MAQNEHLLSWSAHRPTIPLFFVRAVNNISGDSLGKSRNVKIACADFSGCGPLVHVLSLAYP